MVLLAWSKSVVTCMSPDSPPQLLFLLLYEFYIERPRMKEGDDDDELMNGATQAAEVKRIRAGYYSRIGVN